MNKFNSSFLVRKEVEQTWTFWSGCVRQRCGELVGIGAHQPVLDRPPGGPAGADQNQGLPAERLHQRHLLVQRQLGFVELHVLRRKVFCTNNI